MLFQFIAVTFWFSSGALGSGLASYQCISCAASPIPCRRYSIHAWRGTPHTRESQPYSRRACGASLPPNRKRIPRCAGPPLNSSGDKTACQVALPRDPSIAPLRWPTPTASRLSGTTPCKLIWQDRNNYWGSHFQQHHNRRRRSIQHCMDRGSITRHRLYRKLL